MTKRNYGQKDWVVLADGSFYLVVALVIDGKCAAVDFLAASDSRVRARFERLIKVKAETGRLQVPENYRRIQDSGIPKVYEFKVHYGPGYRLYAIESGRKIFVTHGQKKPKDKLVVAEARKAREVYREWQASERV